jgi:succinate dehydrogenase hydrophobic anchor subunit
MKERQRKARQDWVLMRVTTVVLVLTAIAVLAIISLMIATYS